MTILSDYINNDYKPLKIDEPIADVQDFFDGVNFSHFPVLEDGIYIGSISRNELESHDADKLVSDYKYSFDRFFTRENSILLEVLDVFSKNNANLLPVLNDENKYLGYYEIEEIIKRGEIRRGEDGPRRDMTEEEKKEFQKKNFWLLMNPWL